MRRLSGLILVLSVLFVAGCAPPNVVIPTSALPTPAAGLANAAAVFCQEKGFRIEIRTDAAGNQSGVCIFPDGSECDEWAHYRGECGPAGQETATASAVPSASATGSVTAAPPETPAATRVLPGGPTPTAVSAGEPAPGMPAAVGVETYSSPALGISFSYLPKQNGQTINVLEQGDKIFVYPANMEPTAGQWVQVFEKRPDESLVDAITRLVMPGHPAADCRVVPIDNPMGSGSRPANYEYAGIVVRREAGEAEETVLSRWRTCPQPYTVVGGIGYFQADKLHPDKFLFFSIGQYGILAGRNVPWQETIRVE